MKKVVECDFWNYLQKKFPRYIPEFNFFWLSLGRKKMLCVPPSFVGFARPDQTIGAAGCNMYLGLILRMEHLICVCNFVDAAQVSLFFTEHYRKIRGNNRLLTAVMFSSQPPINAVHAVRTGLNQAALLFSHDSMHVKNGLLYKGTAFENGDAFMQYCLGLHQESLDWISLGNADLRFIWSEKN